MKIYININQKAFAELAIKTNIKIDLIDAAIFEYIFKFSSANKVSKKLIDNKIFSWISYQKIIDDNPLLNINSKRVLERRINKLKELNLLEKMVDKKLGNKTFFNITDFAFSLMTEDKNNYSIKEKPMPNNEHIYAPNNTDLCTDECNMLCTEEYDNSKLINSKLDRNKNTHNENQNPREQKNKNSELKKNVVSVFEFWKTTFNHEKAILDKNRISIIEKAFKLGYEIDSIQAAITGCRLTPFNMGDNDRKTIFDGINVILKNAENIERFIANSKTPPISPVKSKNYQELNSNNPRVSYFNSSSNPPPAREIKVF